MLQDLQNNTSLGWQVIDRSFVSDAGVALGKHLELSLQLQQMLDAKVYFTAQELN